MARKVYNLGSSPRAKGLVTSLMSKGGINLRVLSQLLDTNFALRILNFLIDEAGQLFKRGGLERLANLTVTKDYTLNVPYYGDVKIVGYDTTVSALNTATGVETVIKSDFNGSAPVSGTNYGDYFLIGSGGNYTERIGRITLRLDYDTVANDFWEGFVITGTTSGATATVFENDKVNGTLTLGNLQGTFLDNEIITDNSVENPKMVKVINVTDKFEDFGAVNVITGATSGVAGYLYGDAINFPDGTRQILPFQSVYAYDDNELVTGDEGGSATTDMLAGSALVKGSLYYAYEEIAQAPKAKYVYAFLAPAGSSAGTRLFAGNMEEDKTLFQGSDIDTGLNPPFDYWTTTESTADTGFLYINKNHGELKTIASLSDQIIIGYENGDCGFRINSLDVGGTISKLTPTDFDNPDLGMASGAISTSAGVFYGVEKTGLFQMLSGGTTNQPYSRNAKEISLPLGREYFADVNMDNLSIVHDAKRHLVLFSFGKASKGNNIVWAFNLDTGSWSELSMNISRFCKKNDIIYGTSSKDGKYFEVFKGNSDDGKAIPTEYKQEINFGSLDSLKDLWSIVLQARLGEDSEHYLDFDVYDKDGNFVQTAIEQRIIRGVTPTNVLLSWGSAGFGSSGWTNGSEVEGLTTLPYETSDVFIPELWRLILTFTSNDTLPASYNFFNLKIVDRGETLLLNNITTKEEVLPVGAYYVDDEGNFYVDDLGNYYVDS